MQRVQAKVNDSHSQEAFSKLSSLIDYYNRPANDFKEVKNIYIFQDLNWNYWNENIRTQGLVDKVKAKYEDFQKQEYNIDNIAQRSTANSERFDNYVYLFYSFKFA